MHMHTVNFLRQMALCGDYRLLNTQTTVDKYPVRCLTNFGNVLAGKRIFIKIALFKGYHQIPVEEEDVKKRTGVITPFGFVPGFVHSIRLKKKFWAGLSMPYGRNTQQHPAHIQLYQPHPGRLRKPQTASRRPQTSFFRFWTTMVWLSIARNASWAKPLLNFSFTR